MNLCSWEQIPAYSQRPHLQPSVTRQSGAAVVRSQGTALRSAEVRQELRQTRSPSPAKGCTPLCSPSPGRTAAQRSRCSLSIPFPLTSVLLHTLCGVGHTTSAQASCSSKVGTSPALLPSLAHLLPAARQAHSSLPGVGEQAVRQVMYKPGRGPRRVPPR